MALDQRNDQVPGRTRHPIFWGWALRGFEFLAKSCPKITSCFSTWIKGENHHTICTGCMQRGIAPARLARTLQPSGSGGMQPIRAGGERSDLCYFFVPPHDIILCTFWTLFSVHARSTKFDGYHLTSHHIINIHMLYMSSAVACSSHVAPKPKWLKLALSESKMFEEIKMFNLENLY